MGLIGGGNAVVFNGPAGSYKISVLIKSTRVSLNSYHPGVPSAAEAEFIEVVLGEEPKTIDFPVKRGRSLKADLVDENGEPALIPNGVYAEVELAVGGETTRSGWVSEGESGFSFGFLTPGEYEV